MKDIRRGPEPALMPPMAIELEQTLIGSILTMPEIMGVVHDIVTSDDFYRPEHQLAYQAIENLYKSSYPIDIATVTTELTRMKKLDQAGGPYAIVQYTNSESYHTKSQFEFHARIIKQKSIKRKMILMANDMAMKAYDDGYDCFDLIDDTEKSLTDLVRNFSSGKIKSVAALWNDAMAKNDVLLQKKGLSGVPSGYHTLDAITGGWQSPDLIIMAARPAMGKTALMANFARNASVDFKIPGLIFSLEMSALQLATRIFSLESNVSIGQFTRRGIQPSDLIEVTRSCNRLINAPLWIDETPGISISELRSKARKMVRDNKIKYIAVDYLQLMSGSKSGVRENREQEVSSFSRGLKSLAKELNIPVIALSQLSRNVEHRGGDKKPQLSDLRESGAIEQDADMVIFIHRPEYYGITGYEDGSSTAGVAEIIFAKHRNGPIGTEKLKFIAKLTKFEDPSDELQNLPEAPSFDALIANTDFLDDL